MSKTRKFLLFMASVFLALSAFVRFADAMTCATFTGTDEVDEFGRVAPLQVMLGQPFTVLSDCAVTSIDTRLRVGAGSPSDDVTVFLYSGASNPTTLLEQGTDLDVVGAYATYTSTFTGSTVLTSGHTYWYVLGRSGSTSNTAYYQSNAGTSVMWPNAQRYNGTIWSSPGTYNLWFTINGDAPTPPATSTAATSSLDQSQQNLAWAFLLFYITFLGTVWLMRKH